MFDYHIAGLVNLLYNPAMQLSLFISKYIFCFLITSIYLIEDYPAHKALWGFPHIIMLHVIVI